MKAEFWVKAGASDAARAGVTDGSPVRWIPPHTGWSSEWHYTPKHGSWLDMAECEFSVVSTHVLIGGFLTEQTLIDKLDARQNRRQQETRQGGSAVHHRQTPELS